MSATPAEILLAKIEDRSALAGVIGPGYVGPPLVERFADKGFRVLGFDIDPIKEKTPRSGQSDIGHIDSRRIRDLVDSGRFDATSARHVRPRPSMTRGAIEGREKIVSV